jgi:hypothetical protein
MIYWIYINNYNLLSFYWNLRKQTYTEDLALINLDSYYSLKLFLKIKKKYEALKRMPMIKTLVFL